MMRRENQSVKAESIVSALSGMTLRERKSLHESVKRRIIMTEAAASASTADSSGSAQTSLENLEFDTVINDRSGQPAFRKTKTGWQVLVPINKSQMLALVSDESARKELERQIDKTGQGDEINIPAQLLRDKDLANRGNDLTFRKSGDNFVDAEVISNIKMQEIIDATGLTLPDKAGTSAVEFKNKAVDAIIVSKSDERLNFVNDASKYMIGNVKIEIGLVQNPKTLTGKYAIKLMIPLDQGYKNFDSLFGEEAEIGRRILENRKKEAKKGAPVSLKIPVRFASQKSLVKQLATNFFNIGKIPFTLEDDEYVFYDRLTKDQYDNVVKSIEASSAQKVTEF